MPRRPESSFVERVLRRHPRLMWISWLLLVLVASLSLMYMGYAPPTLYEGF